MESLDNNDLGGDVAAGLRKVLNTHGYGFHYSVLQRARELAEQERSYWVFEAAEFPVRAGSFDTRIDFLLKRRHEAHYLAAECKRANPATANWCFVRAPLVARDRSLRSVTTETMIYFPQIGVHSGGDQLSWSDDVFHLAFELRTGEKGNSGGSSRTQVEEAAGQVLKGVNGLVEFFARHLGLLKANQKTPIIPVIFTTAQLWASDTDLSMAELQSGNLSPEAVRAERKDWLWFQYHQSPSLKHARPSISQVNSISDAFESEFARAIAIVSPSGIDNFLMRDW